MAKKRVHQIAKQQGLTSKEVLAALNAAGIEATAAASSVEEEIALKALNAGKASGDGKGPEPESSASSSKTEGDAGKTSTPKPARRERR